LVNYFSDSAKNAVTSNILHKYPIHMKKAILLPICLLLIVAVHAQNQSVLVKDSILYSEDSWQALQLYSVTTSAYNSDCSKYSDTTVFLDTTTGQVESLLLTLYDYYSDGSLFHQTVQKKSGNNSSFENSSRETFTYTAFKVVATHLTETWNGSAWIPYNLITNTYDAQGYLKMSLYNLWDTAAQTWTYTDTSFYYNNNKGLPDSVISYSDITTGYRKDYYTYDSLTSMIKWFVSKNVQISGPIVVRYSEYEENHFYDSTNYIMTDSTDIYMSVLTLGGLMYAGYRLTNYIYNTDNTLKNIFEIDHSFTGPFYSKDGYGYAPCSSALPVTLFSFSGEQKNNNAILHWQTTNEKNASYFSIQRSADAINFTTIGKVKAAGNSSVLKDYTFTDANISLLNTQKLYYRMATTSNDGSIAYSKIIPISITAGRFIIAVSPNPFTDNINVNVPVVLQDARVIISDVSGKIMYNATQHALSGKLTIDASSFAKGVYILSIQSAGNKQVFKIVK
jgi:hypothetical protein